jgi:mercuric ion transport protein
MTAQSDARPVGRWLLLDKLGAIGALLAASAVPCCFPLLAAVGATLGLGALQSLRGYMDYAIQAMVALALVGNVMAYRQHRRLGPLVLELTATAFVFFAYYGYYHVLLIYAGLLALAAAAVWNVIAKRRCPGCC